MEKLGSCSEKLDMGDPFLNYFTLVRGGGAVLRHHRDPRYSSPERSSAIIPHADAIHAGVHAARAVAVPLVWAMAYRHEYGWGVSHESAPAGAEPAANAHELEDLQRRVAELENSMRTGGR